jgi:hypothetical protein
MATPQQNEKRLDQAQHLLLDVLLDVSNNITKYDSEDYRKLLLVWADLTKVTLRKDI